MSERLIQACNISQPGASNYSITGILIKYSIRKAIPAMLLNHEISEQIKTLFDTHLVYPVELLYFSKTKDCDSCEATRQVFSELADLSDKLSMTEIDLDENSKLARKYNIAVAPSMVLAGRDQGQLLDYGVRFLGIPSGYEFSALIQAIRMVSTRDSGLNQATRDELAAISDPVHLQVFVTPT
jgi:alkyl hydroperoxide reductase subunit AhpF